MEIGIDIEQNSRFKNMSLEKLKRIFTENEIEYAQKFSDPEKHFCAFWCGKEALVKALSNKSLKFSEIEIQHSERGKPFFVINELLKNELERLGLSAIKISLSHSIDYSTAMCIIY